VLVTEHFLKRTFFTFTYIFKLIVMKKVLFILLVFVFQNTNAQEKQQLWLTNYDEAVDLAKKENKQVLLFFTGSDWCGWCKKLKQTIIETPEFKTWAAEKLVLVEVDFPKNTNLDQDTRKQNSKLAKSFGILSYPTVWFVNQKEEKLGSLYYGNNVENWLAQADEIMMPKKTRKQLRLERKQKQLEEDRMNKELEEKYANN
jgi:protein disulfide-isomerase